MDINNYTDYLIYNDGRVYNKKYNRFLKPGSDRGGYKYVVLSKKGKCKTHKIHRLIAGQYIPNPENKRCIDHINRIRTDNRVENLRWATDSENQQNRLMDKNNTSGHKNISYDKQNNSWQFQKYINNKRTKKYFKTKTDALCYKFIFILLNQ